MRSASWLVVEGALGALQEGVQVPGNAGRRPLVAPVGPERRGHGIDPQVVGLHGHDLLKMGMNPVPGRRVLVDASPRGIDQLALEAEHVPRDRLRIGGPAGPGAQAVLDVVGVKEPVLDAPAADRAVVARKKAPAKLGLRRIGRPGLGRANAAAQRGHRGAGRRVVDDRLKHGRHLRGIQVPAPPHDLAAVGGKDDGRRPAVVLVPVREVGPGVLVDADRHVARAHERDHLGVPVGRLVHDVAPVAPHRLQVHDHELVLPPGRGERGVRPRLPCDRIGCPCGPRGKGREGGNEHEASHAVDTSRTAAGMQRP